MLRRPALALLVVLGLSCAGAPPSVPLGDAWPESPRGYRDAHDRWTRHTTVHDSVDQIITVRATALSPEWRAAYVAEAARRMKLSETARAELEAKEKAAAGEAYVFEVLVATHKTEWNDLAKWPRSLWRVSLIGDGGREVLPAKIELDRRLGAEITSWFRGYEPFYKAYVVSFPRAAADGAPALGDAPRTMTLRIASSLGTADLVWSAE